MKKENVLLICVAVAFVGFIIGRVTGPKSHKPSKEVTTIEHREKDDNDNKPTQVVKKTPTLRRQVVQETDPRLKSVETPYKGTKDAPIHIVEFSDFQCPFCSRVNPTIKEILETYPGKVKITFRHNPLPFHSNAFPAAVASMAAGRQGKFWQYHDRLFGDLRGSRSWNEASFVAHAKEIGLDIDKFKKDFADPTLKAYVRRDQAIAAGVGARGTPNLFVNGEKVVGARPFSYFKTIIDKQLVTVKEQEGKGRKGSQIARLLTLKNNRNLYAAVYLGRTPRGLQNTKTTVTNKTVFRVPVNEAVDHIKGPKYAPITIVAFSDFQCPFCSRVNPSLKQVMDTYKGKVRVIFRNFPLQFHKDAMPMAEGALAAGAQGKFWNYHDILFKQQRKFRLKTDEMLKLGVAMRFLGKDDSVSASSVSVDDVKKYAGKFGITNFESPDRTKVLRMLLSGLARVVGVADLSKFDTALEKGAFRSRVRSEMLSGVRVGVRGTPNLFVNGRQVSGARPFSHFKTIIDDELKKTDKLLESGVKMRDLYAKLIASGRTAPKPRAFKPSTTVYKVEIADHTPCKGPKDALLTIVEFSDFQCPFCKRAMASLNQIFSHADYKGNVRLCYVNNPLSFHRMAKSAAIASMVAKDYNKFWQMHDKFFEGNNYRTLSPAKYIEYAKGLGINEAEFTKKMAEKKFHDMVEADMDLASSVGARGTPNFFINGIKLVGARPFEHFKMVLDAELKKAKALVAKGTSKSNVYAELIKNGRVLPGPKLGDKLYEMNVEGSPFKGPKDAKVTLVEFSDFQCPYCSRATIWVNGLIKAYPNKLKVVFKHMPLSFHKRAKFAAIATMAAHRQDKFWPYHDIVFRNMRKLSDDDLMKYAKDAGLDVAKFKKDLSDPELAKQVEADMALARKVGVRGTPTFFINGRKVESRMGYSLRVFQRLIDKL